MPRLDRKRENDKASFAQKVRGIEMASCSLQAAMAALTVKRGQQPCCSLPNTMGATSWNGRVPILPAVDDEDEDHDNWLGSDVNNRR